MLESGKSSDEHDIYVEHKKLPQKIWSHLIVIIYALNNIVTDLDILHFLKAGIPSRI